MPWAPSKWVWSDKGWSRERWAFSCLLESLKKKTLGNQKTWSQIWPYCQLSDHRQITQNFEPVSYSPNQGKYPPQLPWDFDVILRVETFLLSLSPRASPALFLSTVAPLPSLSITEVKSKELEPRNVGSNPNSITGSQWFWGRYWTTWCCFLICKDKDNSTCFTRRL